MNNNESTPSSTALAPQKMIIGSLIDPQRVRQGNDFTLTIAAQLLDERGTAIPNVDTTWRTTTAGATIVTGPGPMNGTFTLRNVQLSTAITFTVSTQQYPAISATHSLSLIIF